MVYRILLPRFIAIVVILGIITTALLYVFTPGAFHGITDDPTDSPNAPRDSKHGECHD